MKWKTVNQLKIHFVYLLTQQM